MASNLYCELSKIYSASLMRRHNQKPHSPNIRQNLIIQLYKCVRIEQRILGCQVDLTHYCMRECLSAEFEVDRPKTSHAKYTVKFKDFAVQRRSHHKLFRYVRQTLHITVCKNLTQFISFIKNIWSSLIVSKDKLNILSFQTIIKDFVGNLFPKKYVPLLFQKILS